MRTGLAKRNSLNGWLTAFSEIVVMALEETPRNPQPSSPAAAGFREGIVGNSLAGSMSSMVRAATLDDAEALRELIQRSARVLARGDYSTVQIEAALQGAWGVDTQLVRDGTYFVVERDGCLAACGGWSRRKTLFGGDAHTAREPDLLDPSRDAARIRAFFVHPSCVRQGIGRMLLKKCETEAQREGFRAAELVATLPGVRLYAACGYEEISRREYLLGGGVKILFVTMRRRLD